MIINDGKVFIFLYPKTSVMNLLCMERRWVEGGAFSKDAGKIVLSQYQDIVTVSDFSLHTVLSS